MLSTSRKETLLDALLPAAGTSPNFAAGPATHGLLRLAAQLVLVLAGSMLLAASAQFKMVIPFSPVPVTGQTLVVLMIGLAYGSRLGAVTVLAYIFAGLRGLPVFAGGTSGWVVMAGPSGGYLVGFLAAVFVMGLLAERGMGRNILSTALAMLAGNMVIYLFGYAWLASLIGPGKAFVFGVQPFLWGDAIKLVVAAWLMPFAWRAVKAMTGTSCNDRG
jgi:biotin transport system substrate-specific component